MTTSNLQIFTVATHENHHLDRLKRSAEKHNINLQVYGLGKSFPALGMKRLLMHEFLTQCDPNDMFMFVDAYDVIFLAGEDEILAKYKEHYDNQIVFSAEQNLGMYTIDDIYYFLKYPISNKRYKYLNTGSIIGPVKKGIEIFESVGLDKPNEPCDQVPVLRYFTHNPSALTLDCDHHLFGVNGGRAGLEERDYKFEKDRLYSVQTKTWPILFHVPGKFFIALDKVAKKLGFMDVLPEYSKQEKKLYSAAKKDHELCDKLGIENYTLRLIKNWTTNIGILLILFLLIQQLFNWISR
tara:strand:- start:1405 stop:2292 length:888 start_codon:yes stop_codon:yes gene_type:complete